MGLDLLVGSRSIVQALVETALSRRCLVLLNVLPLKVLEIGVKSVLIVHGIDGSSNDSSQKLSGGH
jgi:hypothetical protein